MQLPSANTTCPSLSDCYSPKYYFLKWYLVTCKFTRVALIVWVWFVKGGRPLNQKLGWSNGNDFLTKPNPLWGLSVILLMMKVMHLGGPMGRCLDNLLRCASFCFMNATPVLGPTWIDADHSLRERDKYGVVWLRGCPNIMEIRRSQPLI